MSESNSTPDGLDATAQQVFIGRGNLYGLLIENNTGTDMYVQIFDAADTGDVTVGTTKPDLSFRIPADGAFGKDVNDSPFAFFEKGVVVAGTTTRDGNSSPASKATATFWYYNMKTFG